MIFSEQGFCEHIKWKTIHTCSIDGKNFYCVYCLWFNTKNLPSVEINVFDFEKNVDQFSWDGITVNDILNYSENPEVQEHQKKYHEADLSYPILVQKIRSRYVILDGCHRFAKAIKKENLQKVNCIEVPESILEKSKWL